MALQTVPDSRILGTLKSVYGFSSFRPLQEEIVRTLTAGRDVFVLMPTGGGKSLCYQLPALLRDGVTVVVSPLIALMKDQVDALEALGVKATFINSSLPPEEAASRQQAVARGAVKLVYVAPERLMMPGFLRMLAAAPLAGFAIDEAHCISEWGHDFRPEYRDLTRLRELFPGTPIGAFTATATARVQEDIRNQLKLRGAAMFRGSFNRENLFYEVRPKERAYEQLRAYLSTRRDASGIIYCMSRAGTEDLAERLRADGFKAQAYHAGLEREERRRRQEDFRRDRVPIIVATIAFGMGIDKPDVRFVIHYDLPKTLEGYYQESGRAGRDGESSDCILFFSGGDAVRIRHFIRQISSPDERRVAEYQLRSVLDWAEASSCRRRSLLAYFDEESDHEQDPCCDICRQPVEREDYTTAAQMILSCVKRTRERFGMTHVINVLRGSRAEQVLKFRHDQLSTYGIGKERSDAEWKHIARELLREGYLRQEEERFVRLVVTQRGEGVLSRGERAMLARPRITSAAVAQEEVQPHPELFQRLRALRGRLAEDLGLPPYVVFHDGTLREMAARLPASREELLRVPGVGQQKLASFGDRFLQEIAEFVRETGAEPIASAPREPRPKSKGVSNRAAESVRMFRDGLGVDAIAVERGRSPITIAGHLSDAIEAGEQLDLDRLVAPDKRMAIEPLFAELGDDYLGPVKERLGDDYSYDELRFVRAVMRGRRTGAAE